MKLLLNFTKVKPKIRVVVRKTHYEVGGGNYEVKFGEIRRANCRQVKFSRRVAVLFGEIGDLY